MWRFQPCEYLCPWNFIETCVDKKKPFSPLDTSTGREYRVYDGDPVTAQAYVEWALKSN